MERGGDEGIVTLSLLEGNSAAKHCNSVNGVGGRNDGDRSLSVTAVLVLSTAVACFGSFSNGFISGYSSPVESEIMDDLGLSLAEFSVFGSIWTVGGMISAVITGKITDVFGRRGTLWFANIFCTVGWLLIALAEGYWWLILGRLLTGFAVGHYTYVVPIYISEITPKNIRGGTTLANTLMVCFGTSLMFTVGTVVSWRALALIGVAPGLLQSIGLFFVPESPRWLAKVGRGNDLEVALRRLRGKNASISQEAADIKDYTETFQQLSRATILDLFQKRYTRSLIVGVGLIVLRQFSGSTTIWCYASYIFESADFSSAIGSTAIAIFQIPASVLGVLLTDKFGRRSLLMVSAAGMCLSCLVVGLSFLLQELKQWKEITPVMVLISLLTYCAAYSFGVSGIPWLLMSEIYPINIKGSAGSLVSVTYWFFSWVMTYIFNYTFEWSSAGTFFLYSVSCGAVVLFTAKLVPETKGRTLEEIQAWMTKFIG